MNRVASNPPVYSLRGIHAYDEQQKPGQLVRRLHNNGQTSRKIYKNTVLWQETS
jgi:hypothetical protein